MLRLSRIVTPTPLPPESSRPSSVTLADFEITMLRKVAGFWAFSDVMVTALLKLFRVSEP